ncbi:hypothetical protein EKE94_09265 [Mesobaculum littorinae]|uniref:Uncharacterized protein n=1 Tax=Mesobaculum littorinae TaxID=2486419 RepID=A0A438AG38_9RHOB|nr:hypothetical protein [Mesobaculum littorinae]RVV97686.1 hypothetical protein EKE94_09265 [Mesobaculum littorinae]
MTVVRETPFGAVEARWHGVVRVVGREAGRICISPPGAAGTYEPQDNDLVRYEVGAWAVPCLDAGPPITVSYTRRVVAFGILPLRPVTYSFTIDPETAPTLIGTTP